MRIGLGGSGANPPHLGHKLLIERLIRYKIFDKLIWVPSGIRKEKDDFVDPCYRKSMTEILFRKTLLEHADKFSIDYNDMFHDNTPSIDWMDRYQKEFPNDEIIWYTGADSVVPREEFGGKCEIEAIWYRGKELMEKYKFLIISRRGYVNPARLGLPPQFEIFDIGLPDISSTKIRKMIKDGDINYADYLTLELAVFIRDNQLYR